MNNKERLIAEALLDKLTKDPTNSNMILMYRDFLDAVCMRINNDMMAMQVEITAQTTVSKN